MHYIFYCKESSDPTLEPSFCMCLFGWLLSLHVYLKLFLSPAPYGTAPQPPGFDFKYLMNPQPEAHQTGDGCALSEGHILNPETVRENPAYWEIWTWSWHSGRRGFPESQTEPAWVQCRPPVKGEDWMPPRDIRGNCFSKRRVLQLLISSYSLVTLAPFPESAW